MDRLAHRLHHVVVERRVEFASLGHAHQAPHQQRLACSHQPCARNPPRSNRRHATRALCVPWVDRRAVHGARCFQQRAPARRPWAGKGEGSPYRAPVRPPTAATTTLERFADSTKLPGKPTPLCRARTSGFVEGGPERRGSQNENATPRCVGALAGFACTGARVLHRQAAGPAV